jgi:outer membrane murein-binding lipoprotein Lpp
MFDGSEWTSAIQPQGKVTEGALENAPVTPPPPKAGRSNPWDRPPTWAKWTAGVVGALLLLGIGSAIGSSGEDDLKTEVAKLESQVDYAQEERDVAEEEAADAHSEASRVRGLRGKIVGEAEDRATEIIGDAKEEKESLNSVQGEITSAENELASVEDSIGGAEEEKALSSIPGDGTFKAEVDYLPGTYRAPGGEGCYWATLNSADPYDIASNENASGPTIANIETPYFQTSGCGTWERME